MTITNNERITNAITEIEFSTVNLYQSFFEEHHVSFELMTILYALLFYKNITQKQICIKTRLPKQTVHNIINKLKAADFVYLIPNEDDRREKFVILTPKGEQYGLEMIRPASEINNMVAERMGIDFLSNLLKDLELYYHSIRMAQEIVSVSEEWSLMIENVLSNKQTKK